MKVIFVSFWLLWNKMKAMDLNIYLKQNWIVFHKTKKVQPLNSTKNHTIAFEGKPVLNVSAAKALKETQPCTTWRYVIEQCCFLPHVVFICLWTKRNRSASYTDSAEATLQVLRTVADALSKFVCIQKWS
jgi:hypothetical protein